MDVSVQRLGQKKNRDSDWYLPSTPSHRVLKALATLLHRLHQGHLPHSRSQRHPEVCVPLLHVVSLPHRM